MKAFFFNEKAWAIISMAIVFIVDILAPLGIAVDVLYICCILIVFRQSRETIMYFGLAATAIIIMTLVLFEHQSKINYITLINHAISALAVLITSYIAMRYQKVNEQNQIKQKKHVAELQEMLFMTSHKVRRPVANIIGLLDIGNDISFMPEQEIKDLFLKLKSSSEDVDDLLRELNKYIEGSGTE